jgi:hypothetical protein
VERGPGTQRIGIDDPSGAEQDWYVAQRAVKGGGGVLTLFCFFRCGNFVRVCVYCVCIVCVVLCVQKKEKRANARV